MEMEGFDPPEEVVELTPRLILWGLPVRRCLECNRPVSSRRHYLHKRFCDKICSHRQLSRERYRAKFSRKYDETKCALLSCAKVFTPHHHAQRFCKEECEYEARKIHLRGEPIKKNCLWCGIEFETQYPKKKFCCKKHVDRHWKKHNNNGHGPKKTQELENIA